MQWNTVQNKDKNKLVTYSSGRLTTTGEVAVSQHQLTLIAMKLKGVTKVSREKSQLRRRVWRLKD